MDCNELYDEDDFWIGARYDGRVIDMAELGSWQIDTKLSEKATCSATPEEGGIAQATAVYYCHRVDEGTPDVAVIKIHKQYCQQLTGSRPHIDARCRIQTLVDLDQDLPKQGLTPDTVPTKELHHFARKELNCLQTLTKEDCKYSPKLYGYLCDTQQPDDWVPGGYVLYLLMERLPGISVDSWMDLPSSEEEDEQLRCALGAALTCVTYCSVIE